MSERILFVHYTPPGVVGGVESILEQHGRLLAARGCHIEVAAGRRGRSRFPVHVIPEMDAARPGSVRIEEELAAGEVTAHFEHARAAILEQLGPLAADFDVVVVHNAFTLHFSLPLTAALWAIAQARPNGSVIAWSHDLAWTNPLYLPALHPGFPWDLLRNPAPNVRYVTVSVERKRQLGELWGQGEEEIIVVPNGIEPAHFLRLSRTTELIASEHRLFDCDAVLLLPVRITRRKNIEAGIRAVRALKDSGRDVRFLISGPVAPHHPQRSMTYLQQLKSLRAELGLEAEVVFLADALGRRLDDRTVFELYTLADAVLFTSEQEGFGLPILEGGLLHVPMVLTDIPIFRELGGRDAVYFGLDDPADRIAEKIVQALDSGPARLYRRVLREYRWEAIVDRRIMPLLRVSKDVPSQ